MCAQSVQLLAGLAPWAERSSEPQSPPEKGEGVTDYVIPPETARTLMTALATHGVTACVGGGWAVDALVRKASIGYTRGPATVRGTSCCMTAAPLRQCQFALQNHTGYASREIDRHDVAVLCERFGLQPPEHYR